MASTGSTMRTHPAHWLKNILSELCITPKQHPGHNMLHV
jgi:hypothetical protein